MWEGLIGQVASQLIGGMFERDAYARGLKRDEAAAAKQAEMDRANREQQFQDIQKYGSAMGPETMAQAFLEVMGAGKNTADVYKTANPGFEQVSEDLGDTQAMGSFNKKTGAMDFNEVAKGLDPTDKYQSDATTRNAQISAGATLGAANIGARSREKVAAMNQKNYEPKYGTPVKGADGMYHTPDGRGGFVKSQVGVPKDAQSGMTVGQAAQALGNADKFGDDPRYEEAREGVAGALTAAIRDLNNPTGTEQTDPSTPGVAQDSDGNKLVPPQPNLSPKSIKGNVSPEVVENMVKLFMENNQVDRATAEAMADQFLDNPEATF
jgi:hypothetical protein